MKWKIVEKRNQLAVHQLHGSRESAERSLAEVIPEYVRLGYYMDKALTADDFEIVAADAEKRVSPLDNRKGYV